MDEYLLGKEMQELSTRVTVIESKIERIFHVLEALTQEQPDQKNEEQKNR